MPFALVTIGLLLIVTGAKNTYSAFGGQVISDFTGPQNFTTWLVAIGAVGAVGYVEELKPLSRAFMALIIISFVIKNGGVFNKLQQALAQGPLHTAENTQSADNHVTSISDQSFEVSRGMDDLAKSVQAGIASNMASAGNAQENFSKVAKFAVSLFV